MHITDIDIFLGDLEFSYQDLEREIGADLAKKITEKSGFVSRFVTSPDNDIFNIGREAINSGHLHQKLAEADLVIVVSEYVASLIPPPSSFLLQNFVSDKTLIVDLNRGCSGFCEAVVLANSLYNQGLIERTVIITAENYSKIIKRSNRTLAPIFSDAIAFTCIDNFDDNVLQSNFGFDHRRNFDLMYDRSIAELHMNGAGIISFVNSKVIPKIKNLIQETESKKAIDYFFAHQGSELVINSINEQLSDHQIKAEFLSSMTGNTNSSSIPLCIKSTLGGQNTKDVYRCLLSGFGVGLSFCNVLTDIRYSNDNC